MSAAPLWTGELCANCGAPLLSDEEERGICDVCASACTYPEEACPECDDAGCVQAPRRWRGFACPDCKGAAYEAPDAVCETCAGAAYFEDRHAAAEAGARRCDADTAVLTHRLRTGEQVRPDYDFARRCAAAAFRKP